MSLRTTSRTSASVAVAGSLMSREFDADFARVVDLETDVDFAGRIIADEHDRETDRCAGRALEGVRRVLHAAREPLAAKALPSITCAVMRTS